MIISYDDVVKIHSLLISEFGGTLGVRDEKGLISALKRPYSGFGETEFYPSHLEKAAAVLESIIKNHPFIDGNKRTAYVLMRLILNQYELDISATQDEKYNFIIAIASGKLDFPEIVSWLKNRIIQKYDG